MRRSLPGLLGAVLVLSALTVAPAQAHIQVRPAQAAPGDPVLWTVLVPSEQKAGTREVELAVPKDVLPFSFEDAPGWSRRLRSNADGSVRSVVWRGSTRSDGLATFRFLASTPEREGEIAWKTIQTYRDGSVVRWIGAAGSENPASVTSISSSATRENAGGEGEHAGGETAAHDGGSEADTASTVSHAVDAGGPDWLARGLAGLALLAALGAIVRRRRA